MKKEVNKWQLPLLEHFAQPWKYNTRNNISFSFVSKIS